ncbi:hypothetical protein EW145_g6759 [Phellinidium pouzarii]|uniref:Plant basic secretory protein n=1 Tax=Phellinidium pouzarii TaxID=167371 RepID=A0A4S4KUF0_9AGAM|nr:hypothetical protein EW145_g6759 [Phellinidium pouzarii]
MPSIHPNSNKQDKSPDQTDNLRELYQPVYMVPPPTLDWPMPKLRLEVKELAHEGSVLFFFKHVNPSDAMRDAVISVYDTLYTKQTCPRHVRSVTLYLENMNGVAYTKGSELDDDHKEIHLSVRHVQNSKQRARDEILGVLVHEMVHCFQYNARGSCPGGLIEGIAGVKLSVCGYEVRHQADNDRADYVRLKAGLSPPHWRKGGNKWDEGYQTTGFFLEWIESTYGHDFVRKLNGAMQDYKYDPSVFPRLTGESVDDLWKLYKTSSDSVR